MSLLLGLGLLAATTAAFWRCLPSGDKPHRIVDSPLESLAAVALCTGFAFGATMFVAGVAQIATSH
jgi:hypothetical protein